MIRYEVKSENMISFDIEEKVTKKTLKELAQSVSEREIQEIIQGQQISDLEIRLLMGGL